MQLCEQQFNEIIKKMPKAANFHKEKSKTFDLKQVKYDIMHGDKKVDMWTGARWVS